VFTTVLSRAVILGQHHIGTLFSTGWAYILLLLGMNFAIGSTLSPSAGFTTVSYMTEPVTGADQGGLRALAALANVLIGFSIAIAYVRRILIDARDFPLIVGARTVRVIVNQVLLTVIGVVSLIPLAILSTILAAVTGGLGALLMLAAPFIALMVVQRFSVVLPAAAVDDALTLKESWHLTRGLGWAMAFAAFVMSLLAGCLIGMWALMLWGLGGLVPADPIWQHMRSAAFPMGTTLISVWVFASLHATFYGLIRERYAEKLGLEHDIIEEVEARRTDARDRAQRALAKVNRMKR